MGQVTFLLNQPKPTKDFRFPGIPEGQNGGRIQHFDVLLHTLFLQAFPHFLNRAKEEELGD